MINKKGFTLVELLVAATIIGFLAAFATAQYRSSVAEARWTRAKSQTDQLAAALQRMYLDYPTSGIINGGEMSNTSSSEQCQIFVGQQNGVSITQLIACGFLENSDWSSEYFRYYSCFNTAGMWPECSSSYRACMAARTTAKLPSSYKTKKYCVDLSGVGQELNKTTNY